MIPNFKAHKHLTVLEKYVKTLNSNKTQIVCLFLDQHPLTYLNHSENLNEPGLKVCYFLSKMF